jgi:hypothetical protein
MVAGIPDVVQARVNRCEDVKQVLDIDILRRDPSRFFEAGLARIKINRQPAEVTIFGRVEEWKRHWVFGAKMVSEWRQHRDESVASIRQGKNAELVKDVSSVGNGGE